MWRACVCVCVNVYFLVSNRVPVSPSASSIGSVDPAHTDHQEDQIMSLSQKVSTVCPLFFPSSAHVKVEKSLDRVGRLPIEGDTHMCVAFTLMKRHHAHSYNL